jgi:ribosomal protein S18 acetylase RimI-like enzyme
VHIRVATPEDNEELQQLQARCPQGTNLIVSVVNTPDFFARAKAYNDSTVFVACEDENIIGSIACSIKQGMVNGSSVILGYAFQAFTALEHRREGVARELLFKAEAYFNENDVALLYTLIMHGNEPSMRLVEELGFTRARSLIMSCLLVYRQIQNKRLHDVKPATPDDLEQVVRLINKTWKGYELFQPLTTNDLQTFLDRTPGHGIENLLLLRDQGNLAACIGFWDWSSIAQITMVSVSRNLQFLGIVSDLIRPFRAMPASLKPGKELKQWMVTPIGFKEPSHVETLLKFLNNQALNRGIEQIFCIYEPTHKFSTAIKDFFKADTPMYLYSKQLQSDVLLSFNPIFIDGVDL